jgi:hypothetical protein
MSYVNPRAGCLSLSLFFVVRVDGCSLVRHAMVEAEGRASWAASARATARLSSPTRTRSRTSRGGGGAVLLWE